MTAPRTPTWWLVIVLLVGGALAGLSALLVVFFLPLRWGSTPFPVSVLGAVAALIGLPRSGFRATGRFSAALVPVLVFIGVAGFLVSHTNALYAVPVSVADWRLTVLVALAGLSAALSLGSIWAVAQRPPPAPSVGPGR